MSQENNAELKEILRRTARGEGKFLELAEALDSLESLALVVPPSDFVRFMGDLERATQEKGYGNVRVDDAEAPRGLGITTKDGGFVPQVFTDDAAAREFAVTRGVIQPDDALPMQASPAANLIFDCLAKGYAGLQLDPETDHQVNLDRRSLARLYALMTIKEFVELETVHVVMIGGKVATQKSKLGPDVHGFAFTSEEAAAWGIQKIQARAPGASTQPESTLPLVQQLLASGVTLLVVDPTTPLERFYDRDDMVRMTRSVAGLGTEAGQRPDPVSAPPRSGFDPALDPLPGASDMASAGTAGVNPVPVERATRFPGRTPVSPPGRGDVDSRAAFQGLRASAEGGAMPIWEYVDALAFDVDLWVPVHPRPVDGLTWPQFFKHPQEEGMSIAYTFTGEAKAREMIVPEPPEFLELKHLSGIEAMRWVWNAPTNIDEVAIDLYQGTDGWIRFPNFWAVSAIYPQFIDLRSLDDVASVGLAKLGSLPGARGLKPEIVRALVRGWKQLLSVAANGNAPVTTELEGRKYLPVFTEPDQYFLFLSQRPDLQARPQPATAEPPFSAWLSEADGLDGVLLDPAGPHPLALDHTDLLVLGLWAQSPRTQPTGRSIGLEIVRLLSEQAVGQRVAGRIVADWPRYFLVLQDAPDGVVNLLKVMVPDQDWCAVFTSQEEAELHLRILRQFGVVSGEWRPVPVLHHWDASVFHNALASFDNGLWIDPVPFEGTGVVVGREMLEAAVQRIDEKLKPRVSGFVWGA